MGNHVVVLTPVLNEEKIVKDGINHILRQKIEGVDLSLRVIANGCTDRTEEIVERIAKQKPNVELISIPEQGRVRALKKGVEDLGNETPVIIVDIDVIFPGENLLELLYDGLYSNPRYGGVRVYVQGIYDTTRPIMGSVNRVRQMLETLNPSNQLRGGTFCTRSKYITRLCPDTILEISSLVEEIKRDGKDVLMLDERINHCEPTSLLDLIRYQTRIEMGRLQLKERYGIKLHSLFGDRKRLLSTLPSEDYFGYLLLESAFLFCKMLGRIKYRTRTLEFYPPTSSTRVLYQKLYPSIKN